MPRAVLRPAARLGLTARAVIYLLIGLLAVLVATGRSTAETDQWGAIQQINRGALGHLMVWVVALGLAGYSLWRFSESLLGVAGEGKKAGPRLKSFARGCVYAVIASMAFQIAVGGGDRSQAGRQASLSAKVMGHSGGRLAVGVVGAVVAVVGATLMYEGAARKFEKYLDLSGTSAVTQRLVTIVGVIGTVARGAVFTLAGIFAIQAAWKSEPAKAAGLDRALRSLRDAPAGPWLLGLVALCLILFGIYGLAEARWRRA
ncbi:MAG TPA: DUF1206 domain-containing protein [Acidimicrobiales bacterium]|nr:DUF1206 domain-containing protein [Acidimicrobiales bacterium]